MKNFALLSKNKSRLCGTQGVCTILGNSISNNLPLRTQFDPLLVITCTMFCSRISNMACCRWQKMNSPIIIVYYILASIAWRHIVPLHEETRMLCTFLFLTSLQPSQCKVHPYFHVSKYMGKGCHVGGEIRLKGNTKMPHGFYPSTLLCVLLLLASCASPTHGMLGKERIALKYVIIYTHTIH